MRQIASFASYKEAAACARPASKEGEAFVTKSRRGLFEVLVEGFEVRLVDFCASEDEVSDLVAVYRQGRLVESFPA